MYRTFTLVLALAALPLSAADAPGPQPRFQGDFFGEMARAFACVVSTDVKAQTLTCKLDKDGSLVTLPILYDTELHIRDSWCELSDYFPGQHVMLFVYVDDDKKWTYPRAIQDDIHVSAGHNWYAKVTAIDTALKTFSTRREEKDKDGKVIKTIEATHPYDPAVKIWKSDTAGAIDTLLLGDDVIQQLVEKEGKKVAVEILDRKGDAAVRAVQDAKHKKDEDTLGLPSYVTDFDPLTGLLVVTVARGSQGRASKLKPNDTFAIQPVDGSKPFAAVVTSTQSVDSRQRLTLVTNSRVVSRLSYGQLVRVFMPGTGPGLPTGRSAVPDLSKK